MDDSRGERIKQNISTIKKGIPKSSKPNYYSNQKNIPTSDHKQQPAVAAAQI